MGDQQLSEIEENLDYTNEINRILTTQQSLYVYSQIEEKNRKALINAFSLLKLGETGAINQFSSELIIRIENHFNSGLDANSFVICSPPSTIEHAAGLMVSQVATTFNLQIANIRKQKPLGDYSLMNEVSDREKAIQGTMEVRDAQIIAGKSVIVIDDVLVTGSVLKELVRALLADGAGQITIFTVLHLDNQDPSFEGKVNEAAISNGLNLILQGLNSGAPVTSAFLKAMVRMSKMNPKSFNSTISNLTAETGRRLFLDCMKYQLMTRGKGGYLTLPDEEFMKIFWDFMVPIK